MLTDPGRLPTNTVLETEAMASGTDREADNKGYKTPICLTCNCEKVVRVHHCSTCNRCIQRMDHHCPWINNCIGFYNQKHFVLYLLYTLIGMVFAFILFLLRYGLCASAEYEFCGVQTHLVLAGTLVTAVFIPFVGYLLVNQLR
jgi:palmitoyltransferase